MTHGLRIGQLAAETGASIETIRYYEQQNLLPQPARSEGNYRLYGEEHVSRLQFIRRCRSLDMALGEIRTLLDFRDAPRSDCGGVNALVDKHVSHVANRIDELKLLQLQLQALRDQCVTTRSTAECAILQGLSQSDNVEIRKPSTHVNGCH
jgi:Cd(II)/Pb(II)-responsive transcriptional regulator